MVYNVVSLNPIPTRFIPGLRREGRTNRNLALGGVKKAVIEYMRLGENAEALRAFNLIHPLQMREIKDDLLYEASKFGNLEILKKLLDMGANINYMNIVELSPLLIASDYGHLDIVRELLERGADVNIITSYGRTPLMQASDRGHLKVVKALLQHDADITINKEIDKESGESLTAINMAATDEIKNVLIDGLRNENQAGGRRRNLTRRSKKHSKKTRKHSKKTRKHSKKTRKH
jgi:ankyrin repeat protein